MPANDNTPLPSGATIRQFSVLDSLAADAQACLYRASSGPDERTVLLHEFMPVGLAVRTEHGVQARAGKAEAFAKAQATYTTRLRAAALVGHPALPTLDDIWQEGGTVYAVGPWRDGRPLTLDPSSRSASPELRTLQAWARTLCDALSALHRHDLVHGNLSPSMIRVLDSGELVLPLVGSGHHTDDAPPWIAPEQHPLNSKPVGVGVWTDVYQLSALMHLLLVGTAPPTVLRRWEGAPLERLGQLVGRVPEGLILATRQGLSMHASARPQSMAAWLEIAGLPDRRERSRYDLGETGSPDAAPTSAAARAQEAAAVPVVAAPEDSEAVAAAAQTPEASPMQPAPAVPPLQRAAEPGHQPVPAAVEERLDQVERTVHQGTPTWVWVCFLIAVGALGAILLLS